MSDWYGHGLSFACTRCGHCCSGKPGYVWISPHEEGAISGYLGLSRAKFRKRYTRLVGSNLSLIESRHGDCVFLTDDRRCSIQSVKPRQCLSFPFWGRIVETRAAWEEGVEDCPGAGKGRLYTPREIGILLDRDTPREQLCKLMSNGRA